MTPSASAWRIAVDTGGTFTDCLGIDPEGREYRAKLLSSGALRRVVAERPSPRVVVLTDAETFVDGFFDGWTLAAGGTRSEISRSAGNRLELIRPAPVGPGTEVVLQSREDAAAVAVRWITGSPAGRKLPPVELRLATTRGTNALLERKGAEVAFFVTRGFGDLLRIGNQQRPDLFALDIRKPEPLSASVVEVDERLNAMGAIVRELDEASLAGEARRLVEAGFRSAAIAFVHSYRNPDHEQHAARILADAGFEQISLSSKLSRRIKIVERAQTALVDAYLAEILARYLTRVGGRLEPRSLHVMTSAGGLVAAGEYRAKDSLLSGPAAGVVGAAAAAARSGFDRLIAFDMGGTSTDVSRVDGDLELRDVTVVGDARLLSPSVAVETVAAGGGSICHWSGGRVRVGPESAGADPGPACYGAGGPLTLTDVNLLLGRVVPSRFPFRVDLEAAARRAAEVSAAARGSRLTNSAPSGAIAPAAGPQAFLSGFLAIANERMAGAIRAISVRRGCDPREYTLVAFGGAGGQHAVALAELLGIRRVLAAPDGALLSAVGLNAASVERWGERQVLAPLAGVGSRLEATFAELAAEVTEELVLEGVSEAAVEIGARTVFLRYAGQESTLAVPCGAGTAGGGLVAGLEAGFRSAYAALYGYLPKNRAIEVESLRLVVRSPSEPAESAEPGAGHGSGRLQPTRASAAQRFWDGDDWVEVPVLERSEMSAADRLEGPGLVAESHTVTVVEKGWSCRLDAAGALLLEKLEAGSV